MEALKTFCPKTKEKPSLYCQICYEVYSSQLHPFRRKGCKHSICRNCIEPFFKTLLPKKCPTCRESVDRNEYSAMPDDCFELLLENIRVNARNLLGLIKGPVLPDLPKALEIVKSGVAEIIQIEEEFISLHKHEIDCINKGLAFKSVGSATSVVGSIATLCSSTGVGLGIGLALQTVGTIVSVTTSITLNEAQKKREERVKELLARKEEVMEDPEIKKAVEKIGNVLMQNNENPVTKAGIGLLTVIGSVIGIICVVKRAEDILKGKFIVCVALGSAELLYKFVMEGESLIELLQLQHSGAIKAITETSIDLLTKVGVLRGWCVWLQKYAANFGKLCIMLQVLGLIADWVQGILRKKDLERLIKRRENFIKEYKERFNEFGKLNFSNIE